MSESEFKYPKTSNRRLAALLVLAGAENPLINGVKESDPEEVERQRLADQEEEQRRDEQLARITFRAPRKIK